MGGLIREGILFIPFKTWGGKEGIGMIRAQVCDGIRMCVQGRQSQTGHSATIKAPYKCRERHQARRRKRYEVTN